jgi:opacity protein-like surface antigen
MKRLLAASAVLFATSTFAAAAPSLTGNWTVHNSVAGNESEQQCKFVQTDDKLSGTCKGTEKDVQITGTITGNKLTWQYESEYNGSPLTMIYTATLDDSSKISGSVEVQPYSVTGDFTATPSKEAAK